MPGRRMTLDWAATPNHLGGTPRRLIFAAVGAFSKVVATFLNSTSIHNSETLLHLVRRRPPGTPLLTVSNHMSTLDDPLLWGFKGFPSTDSNLGRWSLAAEDICFKNSMLAYFFRIGKCIPISRGAGIYQENMNEALDRLSDGEWLHTFPEGKVYQDNCPIRRLKWGTASLIVRAPVTPILLPIVHCGFQEVMPEKFFFGRRPPLPLCKKKIDVVVGEPMEFDLVELRQAARSIPQELNHHSYGWPTTEHGLDEAAQRWLYMYISNQIQSAMESLRCFAVSLRKLKVRC
ncbi:unnamed protein product [Victoria cruziana]